MALPISFYKPQTTFFFIDLNQIKFARSYFYFNELVNKTADCISMREKYTYSKGPNTKHLNTEHIKATNILKFLFWNAQDPTIPKPDHSKSKQNGNHVKSEHFQN